MPICPVPLTGRRAAPRVAWLGDTTAEELALARARVAELANVVDEPDEEAAETPDPTLAVLAAHRPARWTLTAAAAVSRRWPLTPLVAVVTSLADGRRRSGPWLPGVEEVPWHDLPGRLTLWLLAIAAGRPGSLAHPATARREERFFDAASHVRSLVAMIEPRPTISVASPCPTSLEGLADLVTAAGFVVTARTRGRPRLQGDANLIVWDACQTTGTDLAWLGMLAANRPSTAIVLLDSFPRGDSTRAAVRAGAAAVLARPVGLEALAGTLLHVASRHGTAGTGIGAGGHAG